MKTARQLERDIADHQAREKLGRRVQRLLDRWEPILGVRLNEFRVKKMRAFATLNVREGRLWVSLALANTSPADLEYVVVHELVHLLVGDRARAAGVDPTIGSGHDEQFYALMDRYLPTWRRRHARLRDGDGAIARGLPGM